MVRIRQRLREI